MHDVIISGCGAAGGYLAGLLDGLDVLVLEKTRGAKKDSGIVSRDFLSFGKHSHVHSKIHGMKAVSPSGITFTLGSKKPFAYILKRNAFSHWLRSRARKNADIRYEAARKVSYSEDCVTVSTDEGSYSGRIVVGADGALSTVRKSLGIKLPRLCLGVMTKTEKKPQRESIEVHMNKFYSPDFFSWIIPQTKEYGLMTGVRPGQNFQYFKKALSLPDGRTYASYIPIGTCRSYANRTLLVGDACGQVKPLTGGGIMFSMRAAHHAARVIKLAVEKEEHSASMLQWYEFLWKKDFGHEIQRQLLFRKIYRGLSNKDIDNFFVAFGHSISKMDDFDYDRISGAWKKLPKLPLLKFAITKLPLIL